MTTKPVSILVKRSNPAMIVLPGREQTNNGISIQLQGPRSSSSQASIRLESPISVVKQGQNATHSTDTSLQQHPTSVGVKSGVVSKPDRVYVRGNKSKMPPKEFSSIVMCNNDLEILMGGEVVIISGIAFVNKNGVCFIDCPICHSVTAIEALQCHLEQEHKVSEATCPATDCQSTLSSADILKHIMSFHGVFLCPECSKPVIVTKVVSHLTSKCKMDGQDVITLPKNARFPVLDS